MEFPKLYKKDAKGKSRQWSIKVVGDNEENPELSKTAHVIVEYGEVEGKLVTQKIEVEAKGKKTVWEQGIFNAEKKWRDQKEKSGFTENMEDKCSFITPMLAQAVKVKNKKLDIKYPCHVQPKLDGHRCLSSFDGKHVKLLTRKNIEYKGFKTLKNLLKDLYKSLEKQKEGDYLYFDGELMVQGVPFEELSGNIRKAGNNEDVDIPNIEYHIFDYYDPKEPSVPFNDRYEYLNMIIPKNHPNLKLVETLKVNSQEEFLEVFSRYIKDGYEGIMMRVSDSVYKPSKRPPCLKKYKEMMDSEFEIIGFSEAKGEDEGTVIWICKTETGQEFSVRPKGSRELRREWFLNGKDYIGKMLTVIYQELSELGVPRFPVGKDIRI